ncbi:MAG TPA: hypothetical protein VFV27_03040 [Nevskiaceae bacterium]|nr:hypothetical protein [Nevskiaceae bacterium]
MKAPAPLQPIAPPWALRAAGPPLPWRTRLSITLARARRWEFWPAWLFYPPVVLWILLLGLRHGRMTLFTAANPAIDDGGVVGERKHQTLLPLQARAPDLVASCELLEGPGRRARGLAAAERLGYPLVLKPDVGQRGRGVFIARSPAEVSAYLERHDEAVIAQRYVGGEEYGVFIARFPGEPGVRLLSVVHKAFPQLQGDGQRPLLALILADPRARLLAPLLLPRWSGHLERVLAAGERLPLVEIGAHCRGSLFLDAGDAATPALAATLTRLTDALPGYAFGRIDLRVPDRAALRRGEGLQVLELNGVTAECAHIYHPGTPLLSGYRVLFRQWSLAFALGAAQAARGAPVTGPWTLLRRFREDLRRSSRWF